MTETPHIVVRKGRSEQVKREFVFTREMVRSEGMSDYLREYRQHAWEVFQSLPIPTTRDEAWRRTDLSRLPLDAFIEPGSAAAFKIKAGVDTNGSGVVFTDLRTAEREYPHLLERVMGKVIKPEEGKFSAMTASLADTGGLLYVPQGVRIEQPLHSQLTDMENGKVCFSHLMVYLEEGAEATYLHDFASDDLAGKDSMHSGLVEVHISAGAKLHFYEMQSWGRNVWNFSHERVHLEQDGSLEWIFGSVGSKLTKSFLDIDLAGMGSEARFSGFYFSDENQHLDHDTQQNHLAPNTFSDLLFKGAAKDESRAVWQGMVYVDPLAMKTDGYQSSRNLILSPNARVGAIPGLEILANDVRCSHGVTVGKVDEEQIFYLLSRGIPRDEAERLIVEGFFESILQRIPVDEVRSRFQQAIQNKMVKSGN